MCCSPSEKVKHFNNQEKSVPPSQLIHLHPLSIFFVIILWGGELSLQTYFSAFVHTVLPSYNGICSLMNVNSLHTPKKKPAGIDRKRALTQIRVERDCEENYWDLLLVNQRHSTATYLSTYTQLWGRAIGVFLCYKQDTAFRVKAIILFSPSRHLLITLYTSIRGGDGGNLIEMVGFCCTFNHITISIPSGPRYHSPPPIVVI